MKILFFAWCREQLGCEQLELPATEVPATVAALKQQLAGRGEIWRQVFSDTSVLCAVNQQMVDDSHTVSGDDEVAFFPPVTGG